MTTIIERAQVAEDLGFVDLVAWRENEMDFSERLDAYAKRSLLMMQQMMPFMPDATEDHRRIKLMHMMISLAAAHLPGSCYHNEAVRMAFEAAQVVGLDRICARTDVDRGLGANAAWMRAQLHWLKFQPSSTSDYNYMQHLHRGTRLCPTLWARICGDLEVAVSESRRRLKYQPDDVRAIKKVAGMTTLWCRLAVTTGEPSLLSEADRRYSEAVENLGEVFHPYVNHYLVARCLSRGKDSDAIRECEKAIELAKRHEQTSLVAANAVSAYSALLLQLLVREGTGASDQRDIRESALKAVKSMSIAYKYSHTCDASVVRRVLGRFGSPNVVRRRLW